MNFTYPAGVLDDAEELLSLLGTFWHQLYQARTTVWSLCRGKAETERQSFQDIQESAATASREKCPVWHVARWHPLVLRADQKQVGYPLLYGEPDVVYGPQPSSGNVLTYAGGLNSAVGWLLGDIGVSTLRTCSVIAGGIAAPSTLLAEGVDFTLDLEREALIFRDDPFGDPQVPQEAADDGVPTVTLWAFAGGYERHSVRDQYGYAIGLEADSSADYRALADAVLDGLAVGPSLEVFHRAFAAMAGVPVAEDETVLEITRDSRHLLVLTDRNVHRFKLTSTAVVAVGDVLRAGQPLVDTVRIDQPNGIVPAGLSELTVPADFFSGVTAGPLTFEDMDVPLTVTENVDGKTKLTWPLLGVADDVTSFFDTLHGKGVTTGQTLANLLDVRPQPQATEPTADNLPATVNPLQMLFANVFRGNLLLVRVRPELFGATALGLGHRWVLRRVLPPHMALLVVAGVG